jgi:AcrR family transcriptional regulator
VTNAESAAPRPYHHGDLRRALIDAALALMNESRDWTFSLREVARRAGVSHNAPYKHFTEKRQLLVAVAATGFEALRDRMSSALKANDDPRGSLVAAAQAYVRHGVANPALYRLMFGPDLTVATSGRPAEERAAAALAKEVLEEIILRGARSGAFAASPQSAGELAAASLSVWSAMHGLTMLMIDDLAGPPTAADGVAETLVDALVDGLASSAHALPANVWTAPRK